MEAPASVFAFFVCYASTINNSEEAFDVFEAKNGSETFFAVTRIGSLPFGRPSIWPNQRLVELTFGRTDICRGAPSNTWRQNMSLGYPLNFCISDFLKAILP